MSDSPTSRTLAECRKRGWQACVVERYIPAVKRKYDAFGFGDVLVMDQFPGSLLIQATTTAHMAERVTKIIEERTVAAREWLERGNRIEVWGWSKRGKAGKRKLWTVRRVDVFRGSREPLMTRVIYEAY